MTREHYIVRVGNAGLASTVSQQAPNHWYYLSPQRIWGLPKGMNHVKVRASFMADLQNPQVTAYVWFLCNSHDGPGHFVQVGIGQPHLGRGPVGNGILPIPNDMMVRLQQGFDHWFEWRPVNPDAAFQDRVRQLPIPLPHFIPTLRRVTADHQSFPRFEALIGSAGTLRAAPTIQAAPVIQSSRADLIIDPTFEADLENIRREQAEPHSQGYIYLIHMDNTTFYKIGMSLEPAIRLRTLQTGNPSSLEIVNTQIVEDMRNSEMALHRQFEAHRVSNARVREWFNLDGVIDEVEMAFAAAR